MQPRSLIENVSEPWDHLQKERFQEQKRDAKILGQVGLNLHKSIKEAFEAEARSEAQQASNLCWQVVRQPEHRQLHWWL